jgi:hypothetical protein
LGIRISGSSPLLDGYDEPEILHSSTRLNCLIGADAGQGYWRCTSECNCAVRLKDHGLEETRDSIAAKLKRGTFAATFLLACADPGQKHDPATG